MSLDGLEAGGVGIICSVLYWPFCEFQLGVLYGAPPDPDAFGYLTDHLSYVERKLADADPDGARHVIVTRSLHSTNPACGSSTALRVAFTSVPIPRQSTTRSVSSPTRASSTSRLRTSSTAAWQQASRRCRR